VRFTDNSDDDPGKTYLSLIHAQRRPGGSRSNMPTLGSYEVARIEEVSAPQTLA